MKCAMLLSSLYPGGGAEEVVTGKDRDRSGRVAASGRQGEPDTALNQLSQIQDSDVRQDEAQFQRQEEPFAYCLQGGQVWKDTRLHP